MGKIFGSMLVIIAGIFVAVMAFYYAWVSNVPSFLDEAYEKYQFYSMLFGVFSIGMILGGIYMVFSSIRKMNLDYRKSNVTSNQESQDIHLWRIGIRVKLISFHGELESSGVVGIAEDFWILVGQEGEIVSEQLKVHPAFLDKGEGALIKFDQSLSDLGLADHNDKANSLWIFISDLEIIQPSP